MTVGSSRPVNSLSSEILRAISTIALSTSCGFPEMLPVGPSYESQYSLTVAPDDPVPESLNKKLELGTKV